MSVDCAFEWNVIWRVTAAWKQILGSSAIKARKVSYGEFSERFRRCVQQNPGVNYLKNASCYKLMLNIAVGC